MLQKFLKSHPNILGTLFKTCLCGIKIQYNNNNAMCILCHFDMYGFFESKSFTKTVNKISANSAKKFNDQS